MAAMLIVLFMACAWGSAMAVCPKMTPVGSLDLNKFMGKWYEHSSFGTLFIHGLDRCQDSTYTLDKDGTTFTMLNGRVTRMFSLHITSKWTASALNKNNPDGNLSLHFKLPVIGTINIPLTLLATDYDNYAIFYMCKSIAFFKFDVGYILTRQRSYSPFGLKGIYDKVDEALRKNNLSRAKFTMTIQKNCGDSSSSQSTGQSGTSTSTDSTSTSTDTAGQTSPPADTTSTSTDTGSTSTDTAYTSTDTASTSTDTASTSTDTASTSTDTGSTSTDTGSTSTGTDSTSTDTASTSTDTGSTSTDTGSTSTDTASTSTDTASTSTDTASTSTDTASTSTDTASTSTDTASTSTDSASTSK